MADFGPVVAIRSSRRKIRSLWF